MALYKPLQCLTDWYQITPRNSAGRGEVVHGTDAEALFCLTLDYYVFRSIRALTRNKVILKEKQVIYYLK